MNAIQFIQKKGIDNARDLLAQLHKFGCSDDMQITVINGMWHRTSNGFTYPELKRLVDDIDLLIEHRLSEGCWGIDDKYGIEGTGMYLEGYAFYSNEEEKAELDRLQEALNRTVKAFGGEYV